MITVTGSLAFDHIMDFPGKFSDHIMPDKIHQINLSFLVNTLSKQKGDTAGKVVSLSKPVVTDRTPAPEPLYQDDPTLPKGTVKQVDWAAQGAKVKFTRSVYRNGEEIIKETWTSFYKPWQAIYLVGTKEN